MASSTASPYSVRFLSTPSARRATNDQLGHIQMLAISIHALREEGDVAGALNLVTHHLISIHALREEGDEDGKLACTELTVFLSTPSARRATLTWISTQPL